MPECFRLLFVNRAGHRDWAFLLARLSVFFFLAVVPFPHNAALKNIGVIAMLLALLGLGVRRQLEIDWRSPILRIIGLLLAVLILTAGLGPDPVDSLLELRKHFLPGLLFLVLIPVVFQDRRLVQLLLAVIAGAFVLRAGLTLWELFRYFPDLNAGRQEGLFIKGFSLDASLYVPALLGLFLLGGRHRWLVMVGLLAVGAAMVLHQSRAPVMAVLLGGSAMLMVLRQWRLLLLGTVVGGLAVAVLLVTQPQISERFAAALDKKSYVGPEGLSARTPIWRGVMEIAAERPLAGYGFGWKKLGRTAVDQGYVERWKNLKNDPYAENQAWYFSLPTDKVNPHNLYLQIYFESGILGLAAYAAVLLTLLWQAVAICRKGRDEGPILAAVVLAYLVGHVILGMANGLWLGLGPSLAFVALLEAVRRRERCA